MNSRSDPIGQRLPAGIMRPLEGFRIAIESLRANGVRAGLTILGVAIGVAVVVIMAALITHGRSLAG